MSEEENDNENEEVEEEEEMDYNKKGKQRTTLKIKWGAPIVMMSWKTINLIVYVAYAINGICIFYALMLMIASLKTQTNIGDFLNMVSNGDGTSIPIALGLSGFFCLPMNIAMVIIVWKSCAKSRSRVLNSILFSLIIVDVCLVLIIFAFAVFCIVHAYSGMQDRLHSGITDAMQNYRNSSDVKKRVDVLQITFHCCGSKTYSEWFDIPWFDSSQASVESEMTTRDDAPFSCCSMTTRYPCIHHDLMSVGSTYLYAPETNLSVSEYGCQTVLVQTTRLVAWKVAVALFFFAVIQAGLGITVRFVQTAHTEMYRFERNSHWHTAWLIGCYKGRRGKMAPKPPPIPEELTY